MSPELAKELKNLTSKARRQVKHRPEDVIRALANAGATHAAATLEQLIQGDRKVRAEALLEVRHLRSEIRE